MNNSVELGYQILDTSEGTVIVNVDNTGSHSQTAIGLKTANLYTSDAKASGYTLSLQENIYLLSNQNDFTKVKSLVGTYITNQIVSRDLGSFGGSHVKKLEFRSVITFDKGGKWMPLQSPEVDSDGMFFYKTSSQSYSIKV